MIEHDGHRRPAPEGARRPRHRRQHHRPLHDRQRPAHELVARRRHDAVPQREEHQLGRRVPRAGLIRWPGRIKPGIGLQRDRQRARLVADPAGRRRRRRTSRTSCSRATQAGGQDLQGPSRRLQPAPLPDRPAAEKRAQGVLLLQRRRPISSRCATRTGSACSASSGRHGTLARSGPSRSPCCAFQRCSTCASDPYERADITSNSLLRLVRCRMRPFADVAGAGRRRRSSSGDVQGVPTESESGELQHRPDHGRSCSEAGSGGCTSDVQRRRPDAIAGRQSASSDQTRQPCAHWTEFDRGASSRVADRLAAGRRVTAQSRPRPTRCHPGTTAPPSKPSSISSHASPRGRRRTSCRPPSASPPSTTTARCGPSSRSISRSQFALDRVKALAPQHPEWKDKQPFKAVLDGRREGAGRGRRERRCSRSWRRRMPA